ncbi:rhomboid family intramembrane serine protease [uncultured Sphingobacterium sp.]|jgi:membrane associated rhomboid family serine protease|uniref:rhomboid family intramembrane serine protease n=1 Tax=uncultured Sphingobacterium sp. TaxID=182688 RepID=UPI00374A86C6
MKFFDIFPTFAEAPYSYIVVPIILVCSIIGFYNKSFFHALILHPYEIARGKRIHTLLTSALIHRNWIHLLFNCVVIFGLGYDMFGNLHQEYGTTVAYIGTIANFFLLIILPNLIQAFSKKNDFTFTAVGASGLSFGLFGFSALFFPLQKTTSHLFSFVQNTTHSWIVGLGILILLTFVGKLKKTNKQLHLVAYLIGSIVALVFRHTSIIEMYQALF